MNKIKTYGGLDLFRVVAAFLIVAIHTSPLASYSLNGDFILSRIIARVAVPFFLMVSGYFLLPQYFTRKNADPKPLVSFLKKLVLLYTIATIIYLPVSIYAGYYRGGSLVVSLLKNLLVDGTFYHLWYFPCAILGVAIIYFLSRRLSLNTIMAVCVILYVIGLFGDSYYGVLGNAPTVKYLYDIGFNLFSYTRNGLFYAPIFLALGGWIALSKHRLTPRQSAVGLSFSLVAMVAEGLLLHSASLQRHDSMYFALLPCSFFLFNLLLSDKVKGKKPLRTLSMWIYIIHPLFIVLVRGFAKLTGLVPLLVDNSLFHYLLVAGLSLLFSLVVTAFSPGRVDHKFDTGRAWIELDMNNLSHNYIALSKLLPHNCQCMAAVKANAYGHGAVPIAKKLNSLGVKAFCVATVWEAVELRKNGIVGEILILGYTHPQEFHLLRRYFLTQTVVDLSYAKKLNDCKQKTHVHIKIDTGMHRQGERCENIKEILQIFQYKNLVIDGIFTHLCVADSSEAYHTEFTHGQSDAFNKVLARIKAHGYIIPKVHMQSSYAVLRYPELSGDYARIGIALYGLLSTLGDTAECPVALLPVLSIKARVSTVKKLLAGEGMGYGLQFTAPCDMQIAVVTIGYGDGLPRCLSCGVGEMLLWGNRVPILGRICMDQTIIDVSEVPDVESGDIVTIIGSSQGEKISACDIAAKAGTISNEILSRLGSRLNRISIDGV